MFTTVAPARRPAATEGGRSAAPAIANRSVPADLRSRSADGSSGAGGGDRAAACGSSPSGSVSPSTYANGSSNSGVAAETVDGHAPGDASRGREHNDPTRQDVASSVAGVDAPRVRRTSGRLSLRSFERAVAREPKVAPVTRQDCGPGDPCVFFDTALRIRAPPGLHQRRPRYSASCLFRDGL
jgi:hypothetical protein